MPCTPYTFIRALTVAALVSIPAPPAVAQPAGTITFEVPVQTMIVDGTTATEGIISGAGSIEHWFAEERGRIFYTVSLDRFGTAEPFDTWLHNTGGVRRFAWGDTTLDAGGAFFWRVNRGGWADAGFRGFNAQGVVDRTLAHGSLSAGYNLYRRSFPDASALTQLEHFSHLRALANLPSRTTLVATVGGGWKRYDGESAHPLPALAAPLGSQAARGRSRNVLLAPSVNDSAGSAAAVRTRWTWSARAAQSLTDRTGVWVEREERHAGGDRPPALVWTPPRFYDDGVYDDPYVVTARAWRTGVRHVFARGDELMFWMERSIRAFDGLDVVDGETRIGLRADTLLRTGVSSEVVLRSTERADVVLLAGYNYVRNDSNDSFESYRSHRGSVGLSLRF